MNGAQNMRQLIDYAGSGATFGAIVLNAVQGDPINKVLTIILSALSIMYMLIQIFTAIPKVKRLWRRRSK